MSGAAKDWSDLARCSECPKALPWQKGPGRPRKTCSPECDRKRQARLRAKWTACPSCGTAVYRGGTHP